MQRWWCFCIHNIEKWYCRDPECGGGTAFCKHNIRRAICRDPSCKGGSAFCKPHNKIKYRCKICNPIGHLAHNVRCRINNALKYDKELHSTEYTQCTIEELRQHIEAQFTEGMSWNNYGKWHIDHIIPTKYKQDGIPLH